MRLCNVCNYERNATSGKERLAFQVDGVNVCYVCIEFLENLSKQNNRTLEQELEHQSKYINEMRGVQLQA